MLVARRVRGWPPVILGALLVAGCGGDGDRCVAMSRDAGCAHADVWETLRQRPVSLPVLMPEAPCPRTPGREVFRAYGPALGDGPVYPVGLGADGVLHYGSGPGQVEGGWSYVKVLWISRPDYREPALIRGGQIDGPNELRFGEGPDPAVELQFPTETGVVSGGTAAGWRDLPSHTRVRAPGCYAYQIDGLSFSLVIVFQAVPD